jgi:hypothetical protein
VWQWATGMKREAEELLTPDSYLLSPASGARRDELRKGEKFEGSTFGEDGAWFDQLLGES